MHGAFHSCGNIHFAPGLQFYPCDNQPTLRLVPNKKRFLVIGVATTILWCSCSHANRPLSARILTTQQIRMSRPAKLTSHFPTFPWTWQRQQQQRSTSLGKQYKTRPFGTTTKTPKQKRFWMNDHHPRAIFCRAMIFRCTIRNQKQRGPVFARHVSRSIKILNESLKVNSNPPKDWSGCGARVATKRWFDPWLYRGRFLKFRQ